MKINFSEWKYMDEWVGKKIYLINFSIFDISYDEYLVLDETITIKNKNYHLIKSVNNINGLPFPLYGMYNEDNFMFYNMNSLRNSEIKVKKECVKIVNNFFYNEISNEKSIILNNIDNMKWKIFIKDKYYKFF